MPCAAMSSSVGCTRAPRASAPVKWTLVAALGKAETWDLYLPFLISLCSLQCKPFTSLMLPLKHNRYLLLFKPLNTWNRVGVFLCSETCLVELISEREGSTVLGALIRQAEGRSSVKGTGCLTKSKGMFLSHDLGSDYSQLQDSKSYLSCSLWGPWPFTSDTVIPPPPRVE